MVNLHWIGLFHETDVLLHFIERKAGSNLELVMGFQETKNNNTQFGLSFIREKYIEHPYDLGNWRVLVYDNAHLRPTALTVEQGTYQHVSFCPCSGGLPTTTRKAIAFAGSW